MLKRIAFLGLVAAFGTVFSSAPARADLIRVTAGFTSFSGVVTGFGSAFFDFCPADTCAAPAPLPPKVPVCPDAGCAGGAGVANVSLGGNPSSDTTNLLSFYVAFNDPKNELDFRTVGTVDADPTGSFKLGTLTFGNGLWSGDADFGFGIVANDLTTHRVETFNGFIHLTLNPNTGTPAQNADWIDIRTAAGQPVVNPLTLQPLPSIRAFELSDSPIGTNIGSVDLWGMFGSLDFSHFDNAVGGVFLDTSNTPDLGGPPSSTPVPEPGTVSLLAAAAIALLISRRVTGLLRSRG